MQTFTHRARGQVVVFLLVQRKLVMLLDAAHFNQSRFVLHWPIGCWLKRFRSSPFTDKTEQKQRFPQLIPNNKGPQEHT